VTQIATTLFITQFLVRTYENMTKKANIYEIAYTTLMLINGSFMLIRKHWRLLQMRYINVSITYDALMSPEKHNTISRNMEVILLRKNRHMSMHDPNTTIMITYLYPTLASSLSESPERRSENIVWNLIVLIINVSMTTDYRITYPMSYCGT